MDYVRKLPLLMGLLSGIITGIIGYTNRVGSNRNMATMVAVMLIFYVIGLMVRNTIFDSVDTHKRKELDRMLEEKRLAAEKKREAEKAAKAEKSAKAKKSSGGTLDISADEELNFDTDDDFSDLPVNDYLNSELKK